MVLFYVQHGLGVFRHLGGDPQHVPVGKRRAANLCLTFRLVLCILCLRRFWRQYLRMPSGREGGCADHLLFFYVQHGLGVFRHLGGNPQHVPVGKRRATNLCLTFRLALRILCLRRFWRQYLRMPSGREGGCADHLLFFMSSMDSEFFAIWAAIRSTSRSESVELRICA